MNSLPADIFQKSLLDQRLLQDDWSDLSQFCELPEIDFKRMADYGMSRLPQQGPVIMYGAYADVPKVEDFRSARAHSYD